MSIYEYKHFPNSLQSYYKSRERSRSTSDRKTIIFSGFGIVSNVWNAKHQLYYLTSKVIKTSIFVTLKIRNTISTVC